MTNSRAAAIAACLALGLVLAMRGTSVGAEAASEIPARPITAAEREHWAYRPIAAPSVPEIADPRFGQHPIDRFLKAALARRSVEPLPRASRTTLARRLALDLTGLPPTPEQIAEFLDDRSPAAYENLVDRLLASPAYGERWAQHWLDLARFAETDGFEHDLVRPNAWRYRDWVIDAMNRDMPFDEFVRMQLAGDELHPGDPQAAVATGFLLCGPDMPDLNLADERRHVVLNEMTSTVGSVFLALQVGCAQCHDHKYDPIRQTDFYRLRAFFESADIFRDHPIPTAEQFAARRAAEAAADPLERPRDKRRRELEELGKSRFRDKNPDERPSLKQQLRELSDDERQDHATLVEQLRAAPKLPELPAGRVMRDGEPRAGHVYLRGDFRQPGPSVECGFPELLAPVASETIESPPERPRTKLADWLMSAENPLVARVMANRIWQWHFGIGLSASASDFGVMGIEPENPELLDWLARRFRDDGWGMKKMHRLIVTSEAYQIASYPFDAGWSADETRSARGIWQRSSARDPRNTLLWRRRATRLDAEMIRDAMLAISGQLSARRGGPGVRPPLPPEVTATLLKDQWQVSGDDEDHRRRSIYLFVRRNLRYPMFDVFDRPDTNASCPLRHESTTATQSLELFNSEFSLRCARHLAGMLLRSEPANRTNRLQEAYLRVFGRRANEDVVRLAEAFLDRQQESLRTDRRTPADLALPVGAPDDGDPFAASTWVDFCLALLNANEFVYVD